MLTNNFTKNIGMKTSGCKLLKEKSTLLTLNILLFIMGVGSVTCITSVCFKREREISLQLHIFGCTG